MSELGRTEESPGRFRRHETFAEQVRRLRPRTVEDIHDMPGVGEGFESEEEVEEFIAWYRAERRRGCE